MSCPKFMDGLGFRGSSRNNRETDLGESETSEGRGFFQICLQPSHQRRVLWGDLIDSSSCLERFHGDGCNFSEVSLGDIQVIR